MLAKKTDNDLWECKVWSQECSGFFLLVGAAFVHQEHFNEFHHMFLSNLCLVDLRDDSRPSSLLPLKASAFYVLLCRITHQAMNILLQYWYLNGVLLLFIMIKRWICSLTFFFFWSVSAACLFRYNALSFVYLIYLLLIPLFAEPTSTSMQGKSRTVTFFEASHAQWRWCCPSPRESWLFPKSLQFELQYCSL